MVLTTPFGTTVNSTTYLLLCVCVCVSLFCKFSSTRQFMSVSNMELLGAGGENSFMNHLACCQFTIMTIIIGFCDSVCVCVCVYWSLSHVQLFATPCTVAHQVPLSMEFSRQEHWTGLPFPSPKDLPYPGVEPGLPHCRQIFTA